MYIQEQWPNIDWYKYLCLWERLSPGMKHVSDTLGVRESFLAQAVQGRIPERTDPQRETHRVHRRFFTALVLHDLVHEVPIRQVARQYGATKGLLQTLQSAAGTFAGMVTVFCNRLGWTNLELLLSQFQSRLTFGVERELCELVKVSLLNGFRARVLYSAGYHTLAALATANPSLVETCLRNAVPFKSYKLAGGEDGDQHANAAAAEATRNTWCAKLRKGMTETEAAIAIVNEARTTLSKDLNVPLSAWVGNPQLLLSPSRMGSVHPKEVQSTDDVIAGLKVHRRSPTTSRSGEEAGYKKCCMEGDSKLGQVALLKHQILPSSHVNLDCRTNQPPFSNFIPASALLKISPDTTTEEGREGNIKTSAVCGNDSVPRHLVPKKENCHHRNEPVFNLSPISMLGFRSNQTNTAGIGVVTPESFPEAKELSFGDSFSKSDPGSLSLEGLPFTIPDSLPCSADVSMSFSFQTLAMIDAVCDAARNNATKLSDMIIDETCDGGGGGALTPIRTQKSISFFSPQVLDSDFPSKCSNGLKSAEHTPLKAPDNSKCIAETPSQFHPSSLRELSSLCSSQLSQSGVTLINVTSNRFLFDTFISECLEQKAVAFSVASTSIDQSDGIGSVVVRSKCDAGIPLLPLQNKQVVGIAFCWGAMDVYYISLSQDAPHGSKADLANSITLKERTEAVKKLIEHSWRKLIAYDLKKHVKLLALSCGAMPACKVLDPLVANWMLNPDAKEKTIHRMVLQYLPEQPLLSECEDYEEMPLSSLATNSGDPEMQASAESILAYMLVSKLEVLLEAEGMHDSYLNLEMPSLLVLAKAELNGIGFSPDECANQRDLLQRRVSELEHEAYTIAGHTFSLTSPEDVASVLFLELKLPSGSDSSKQRTLGTTTRRVTRKRVQHLSTAKDVLEKIQPLHPLPGIVLEWRRISATMSKTVYPLFKDAHHHKDLDCFRIHATVHIHTATGRVSVSDPCLQMVPKEFNIGPTKGTSNPSLLSDSQYLEIHDSDREDHITTPLSVCMRNVFQPFPGAIFLTADYSQLELRILAHMSGDLKLKQFLNSEGDVFRMIAGEWLGLPVSDVSDKQRQDAKQVCYGMLYGIGAKALGEQLGVTDNEASRFMETFKSKYPNVKKFISKTIQDCKEAGYVTTLLGRKRFLPGIHSTNIHARSQAERQAVNTTIQGSAADLAKTAMVNINRKIEACYGSSATCLLPFNTKPIRHAAYLVLQLHDELLYEVTEGDLEQVAGVVQSEMEGALELSVRFPVKIKVGYSWGKLEPALFK